MKDLKTLGDWKIQVACITSLELKQENKSMSLKWHYALIVRSLVLEPKNFKEPWVNSPGGPPSERALIQVAVSNKSQSGS
jgi:hypothetical protein